MLRTTQRALCIDPVRVFATGISNGAMFSTVLACALPGRFAAIAPVSGVNATAACRAGTPRVSVLAFHGTADPIVPYQGGDYFSGAAAARTSGRAQAKGVDDAVAVIRQHRAVSLGMPTSRTRLSTPTLSTPARAEALA